MSTYVTFDFAKYCKDRGLTENNHPFLAWLSIATKHNIITLDPKDTWIAGGSLLTLVSAPICKRVVMKKEERKEKDVFGKNKGYSGSYKYAKECIEYLKDIDVFYADCSKYKWKIRNLQFKNRISSTIRGKGYQYGYKIKRRPKIIPTDKSGARKNTTCRRPWSKKRNQLLTDIHFWKSGGRDKTYWPCAGHFIPDIQLIGFKNVDNIETLLNTFDIDVCRIGFDGEKLYIASEAIFGLQDMNADLAVDPEELGPRSLKTLSRVYRYEGKGFSFSDSSNLVRLEEQASYYSKNTEAMKEFYEQEEL